MKDVYITCCFAEGKDKISRKANYWLLTRTCIASLLHTGFPANRVICVCENKQHARHLTEQFGIQGIHGPPIPDKYSDSISLDRGRKLFFYKPISYFHVVKDMLPAANANICMTDVDAIFVRNPNESANKHGVWSQRKWTYLRPSRARTMQHRHKIPKLDNRSSLEGYFGSKVQADLFLRYKMTSLPHARIVSDYVLFPAEQYAQIIDTWMDMSNYILTKKKSICKGDQEILSSALDYSGIAFRTEADFRYTKQYGCVGNKKAMHRHAKNYGLE